MSICNRSERKKEGRISKFENWGREKKSYSRSLKRYKWRYADVKRIGIRGSLLRTTSQI